MSKLEDVSHEMLVLMLAMVCGVEFLAVLWMRSNYGGSCRNVSVSRCHKKSWISSGFAVSLGEAAEMFLLQGVLIKKL